MPKQLYIPLPCAAARRQMLNRLGMQPSKTACVQLCTCQAVHAVHSLLKVCSKVTDHHAACFATVQLHHHAHHSSSNGSLSVALCVCSIACHAGHGQCVLNHPVATYADADPSHCTNMSIDDWDKVVSRTQGYSGSDMQNLMQEACNLAVRDAMTKAAEPASMKQLASKDVRPVVLNDFKVYTVSCLLSQMWICLLQYADVHITAHVHRVCDPS